MVISENKNFIGVLGGTFDPIHLGHLSIAIDAINLLGTKNIRFIPSNIPVHRSIPQANANHRMAMIELLANEDKRIIADPREVARKGESYMIETIRSLKTDFPSKVICLILGNDAFNEFLTWKDPDEILSLSHIIVMKRPGVIDTNNEAIVRLLKNHKCTKIEEMESNNFGKILFYPATQINISSSDVRVKIKENKDLSGTLHPKIISYISENNLYKNNQTN
tara:strand:- start:10185 stop:10850 length:666 start_codon:yes stop_codon:yes gene_type:complete